MIRALAILFACALVWASDIYSPYDPDPKPTAAAGDTGTNPTMIANLQLHWQYESLPTNLIVTNWQSVGDNTLTMTESLEANRPTNSSRGVWFDGTNDWLFASDFTGVTIATNYSVFLSINPSDYQVFSAGTIVTADNVNGVLWDGNNANWWNAGAQYDFNGVSANNANVAVVYLCGNSEVKAYVNGTLAGTQASALTASWVIKNIGAVPTSSVFYQGYIRRICVYTNKILDANEIAGLKTWNDLYGAQ